MAGNWNIDGDEFKVLINDEEQHSIWPSAQPIPEGWRQIGPVGPKQECLDWINENWPDIAPLSVRSTKH
jgi:MbtH protein